MFERKTLDLNNANFTKEKMSYADAVKDVSPIQWPEDVISGEKKVYANRFERPGIIDLHVLDYNEEKHARTLRAEGREEGREKTRIADLAQMLSRGGTENDLRRFHDATDEEIALAFFQMPLSWFSNMYSHCSKS